jgi:hypothetical protein
MLRLMTTLLNFYIGRSMEFSGDGGQAPLLIRLPLLMLRRILQLFMIGFGSLLVGIIGAAFLLKEITDQLQSQNFLVINASMGISILVVAVGIGACLWTFRKNNWENTENLMVRAEPVIRPQPQISQALPDLMTQILAVLTEIMSEKANNDRENFTGPTAMKQGVS